jgi:hypothetical protein
MNIIPVIGFGLYAAIQGLQHPYPLKTLSNADFEAWLPFFRNRMSDLEWVQMASATSQFSAAASFSGLICVGLYFHRDCCQIMPGLGELLVLTMHGAQLMSSQQDPVRLWRIPLPDRHRHRRFDGR